MGYNKIDPFIMLSALALLLIGALFQVALMLSVSNEQGLLSIFWPILGAGAGYALFLSLRRVAFSTTLNVVPPLLLLTLGLMLLVPFVGEYHDGGVRWFALFGAVKFSPASFVPLLIAIGGSYYLQKILDRGVTPLQGSSLAAVALMFLLLCKVQSSWGGMLVIVATAAAVLLVSRLSMRYFSVILIAIVAVIAMIVLDNYRAVRVIMNFYASTPNLDQLSQLRSAYAVMFDGQPAATIYNFHTDFVFASLVGYFKAGAVVVVCLLSILLWRVGIIAIDVMRQDSFRGGVVYGVLVLIAAPVLLHISINLGFIPTLEVQMPFLSARIETTLATMVGLGVVSRISFENSQQQTRQLHQQWMAEATIADAQLYPFDESLGKRYPRGQWQINTLNDLADLESTVIQRTVRSTPSALLSRALSTASEQVVERFLSNLTPITREMVVAEIESTGDDSDEIRDAQSELLRIAAQQYAEIEDELWIELTRELPTDVELPEESNLPLVESLNPDQMAQLLEQTSFSLLIHAFAAEDQWKDLLQQKICPLWKAHVVTLFNEEVELRGAIFDWQRAVSRRAISLITQNILLNLDK
jgi:cell division protein FtsW (lipid II flippase)